MGIPVLTLPDLLIRIIYYKLSGTFIADSGKALTIDLDGTFNFPHTNIAADDRFPMPEVPPLTHAEPYSEIPFSDFHDETDDDDILLCNLCDEECFFDANYCHHCGAKLHWI